jgi:membrane protein YqaA with SNARE-associated domain
MLEWLHPLSGDLKSFLFAIFGSIAGAIVGGVIKWLFDRAMIKDLKQQREDKIAKLRSSAARMLSNSVKEPWWTWRCAKPRTKIANESWTNSDEN